MKQSAPKATKQNYFRKLNARFAKFDSLKLFYISLVLLGLAVVLLIVAIGVQRSTLWSSRSPVPAAGYQINTAVSMGLVTMNLTNISFTDGVTGLEAPTSSHYAIIYFTIRNNADHPIDVLPSSDIYVKDQTGTVSYLTPYRLDNPFHAGTLLPGEQVKGQLSFVVAKTGSAKMYVDSIWSGGVVSFKIQ